MLSVPNDQKWCPTLPKINISSFMFQYRWKAKCGAKIEHFKSEQAAEALRARNATSFLLCTTKTKMGAGQGPCCRFNGHRQRS